MSANDSEYSDIPTSLRQKVFMILWQKPELTPSEICLKLRKSYKTHGGTISQYKKQWTREYKISVSAYSAKIEPHKRFWAWPKKVLRNITLKEAKSFGWKSVPNRNGMWNFKCDKGMIRGSVQWYPYGAVKVLTKGPSNLGIAKALFCKAFSWVSDKDLSKLCEGVFQESIRHHLIDTGKVLSVGLNIDKFRESHGLRLFVDKTRPGDTFIEAEETVPLYLQTMIGVQNKLAENIEAHLRLIKAWHREATERRTKRKGYLSFVFALKRFFAVLCKHFMDKKKAVKKSKKKASSWPPVEE
jgi:hypothetical protein